MPMNSIDFAIQPLGTIRREGRIARDAWVAHVGGQLVVAIASELPNGTYTGPGRRTHRLTLCYNAMTHKSLDEAAATLHQQLLGKLSVVQIGENRLPIPQTQGGAGARGETTVHLLCPRGRVTTRMVVEQIADEFDLVPELSMVPIPASQTYIAAEDDPEGMFRKGDTVTRAQVLNYNIPVESDKYTIREGTCPKEGGPHEYGAGLTICRHCGGNRLRMAG